MSSATAASFSRGAARMLIMRRTAMALPRSRPCATVVSARPARPSVLGGRLRGCAALRGFGSSRRLCRDVGGEEKGTAHEEAAEDGEKVPLSGTGSEGPNSIETAEVVAPAAVTVEPIATTDAESPMSTTTKLRRDFAFVFDIDGVLLHKSDPIPGAKETLEYLQRHNIPFLFLTNGGGKPEADRVAELSAKLEVPLLTESFVQSHTPFTVLTKGRPLYLHHSNLPQYLKEMGVHNLKDSTVLVLGSDGSKARRIANGYGFNSVVTAGDILKANPDIFPFDPLSEYYDKQEILPLPKPIFTPKRDLPMDSCLKIDAILVFNDPRDWAVDIQLIVDLLLSHRGYLGTHRADHGSNGDGENKGQPALVFSNQDMLWSTGYHQSRFGQGAFRAAVQGVVAALTLKKQEGLSKSPLRSFAMGKPEQSTYAFAQQQLHNLYQKMAIHGQGQSPPVDKAKGDYLTPLRPLRSVYMVGDNPDSDIRGVILWREGLKRRGYARRGRDRMTEMLLWQACLVRTGVWSEDRTPLAQLESDGKKPDTVQDDVKAVVNWVLEKEGCPDRVE